LFLRTATGELYPARGLPPEGSSRLGRRLLAPLAAFLLFSSLALTGRREWSERRVKDLVTRGAAQVTSGNWPAARELFAEARQLAPRSAKIAADLAAAEEQLGDIRSAEDLYREAALHAPESADRMYDLGHFLNDHGSPTEAYAILSEAVSLPAEPPRNGEIYAELARAAMSRKLFGRARIAIATALRLDPERPEYHRRQGEIELLAGLPSKAIPPLAQALDRFAVGDLGRIETLALLAQAEDQIGEGASPCPFIGEFRQLDPTGLTPWAPELESIAARHRCRLAPTSSTTQRSSP
jgi:Tfp pilus assembly protein PilF